MRERYLEKIEKCREWIAFFRENPGWRETEGMVEGDQRIRDAEWLNSSQLIEIERRKIAAYQRYAALYS